MDSDDLKTQGNLAPKRLAIGGALITGVAGIAMAIFSVVSGEETGGGALLAASALAFGLLAANLERSVRNVGSREDAPTTHLPENGSGSLEYKTVTPVAANNRSESMSSLLDVSRVNGGLTIRSKDMAVAEIDAEPITGREREVLSLVAEGCSNKLISGRLGISERTVKNHMTSTMTKLRASDRTHAVVTAVRMGWLDI